MLQLQTVISKFFMIYCDDFREAAAVCLEQLCNLRTHLTREGANNIKTNKTETKNMKIWVENATKVHYAIRYATDMRIDALAAVTFSARILWSHIVSVCVYVCLCLCPRIMCTFHFFMMDDLSWDSFLFVFCVFFGFSSIEVKK